MPLIPGGPNPMGGLNNGGGWLGGGKLNSGPPSPQRDFLNPGGGPENPGPMKEEAACMSSTKLSAADRFGPLPS